MLLIPHRKSPARRGSAAPCRSDRSLSLAGRSRRRLRLESLEDRRLLSINFPDFADPSGLNLLGRAAVTADDILRLTPARQGLPGGAWFIEPQFVSGDFETTFGFQMSEGSDGGDGTDGSDGFAFVIQNDSLDALGRGGGGIGYNGMPNSLVVEFDTWGNSEFNDPSKSHISVHTGGTGPNSVHEDHSLGAYDTLGELGYLLDDAQVHTASISYVPGRMDIHLDGSAEPVITIAIDLADTLDLDAGRAWIGFVGATGGGYQNHDILSWEFNTLVDTDTQIAIDDVELVEGSGGDTSNLVFTVTRLGDTSATTTVDWATADDTATAGSDYVAASGKLSFASGVSEQTITVSIIGDDVEESHEEFFVKLLSPAGAVIVEHQGRGSILNDETTISVYDVNVIEGGDTPRFIDDFVRAGNGGLNSPTGMAIGPDGDLYVAARGPARVLRYSEESGAFLGVFADASMAGANLRAGEVLFGPDHNLYVSTGANHSVLKFDGATGEYLSEFVTPELGGLGKAWGMTFGPDGDLYVGSTSTDEVLRYQGPSGAAPGAFLGVFASGSGLDDPRDLTFGSDGNLYVASAATDEVLRYQGPRASSPGAFIDTFVPAGSGGLDAPRGLTFHNDGKLYVVSANSAELLRYDVATGAFIDTYANADSGLSLPYAAVFGADGTLMVSNRNTHEILRYGPSSQAVFTVSLSSASAVPVTVDFATADGTAIAGSDYTTKSGSLLFDPGVTSRSIVIPTLKETRTEPEETFLVNLSNPSLGAVITDGQGIGTIREFSDSNLDFRDPISLPMGEDPLALTAADLDGDGLLDLATANFADFTVTTRFGEGNVQFSAVQDFFTGEGPVSVMAADLDGQHGLDLVVGNLWSGDTSVLLSRGGRLFAREVSYETGLSTDGLAITDLNGDGVSDILVAAAGDWTDVVGRVSILVGDPAVPGSFAPATTLFEKDGSISVVADDFNQDGELDMAVVTLGSPADRHVSVLLANGDGTFGPATTMQAGPCGYALATADLNGDAYQDLMVADDCSDEVFVFLGRGDGSFDAAIAYGVGSSPEAVIAADLSGDDVLDLATANMSAGTVSVLFGHGDGTFTSAVDFAVEGSPTDIKAADIDGDGDLDLALSTCDPDTVQILLSTVADTTQLRGAGHVYQQDFDARLPADGSLTGVYLPTEWTAVTAGTQRDTISAAFPDWISADTYNAGPDGSSDRTLALGNEGDDALSQLRLELQITEQDLHALTLSFDLEVWGGEPGLAADPGEAAYQVALEVDNGAGFVPLADVGVVSTGASLIPRDAILMDGNAPANRDHFDSSVLDVEVAAGATLAVAFTIPDRDVGTGFIYGLDNVRIQTLSTGDANGDGAFNSSDLVQVFQAGEYEDGVSDNSTFAEGDWNGDGDFTSSDMVMAFQTGSYEQSEAADRSNLAAAVDWLFAEDERATRQRAYVA